MPIDIYLRWIISQIQEEWYIFHGTIFFKVLFEKSGYFHVHLKKKGKIKHNKYRSFILYQHLFRVYGLYD